MQRASTTGVFDKLTNVEAYTGVRQLYDPSRVYRDISGDLCLWPHSTQAVILCFTCPRFRSNRDVACVLDFLGSQAHRSRFGLEAADVSSAKKESQARIALRSPTVQTSPRQPRAETSAALSYRSSELHPIFQVIFMNNDAVLCLCLGSIWFV